MKIRVEFESNDCSGFESAEFKADSAADAFYSLQRLSGLSGREALVKFLSSTLKADPENEEELRYLLSGVKRESLEFLRDTIRKMLFEMSNP